MKGKVIRRAPPVKPTRKDCLSDKDYQRKYGIWYRFHNPEQMKKNHAKQNKVRKAQRRRDGVPMRNRLILSEEERAERRKYQQAYYEAHKEKAKEYSRDYARRNRKARNRKGEYRAPPLQRQAIRDCYTGSDIMHMPAEKAAKAFNLILSGARGFTG